MKKRILLNNFLLVATSLAATAWLTGCCSDHQPTGHIYVGEPAVYTRERLVDQRLKDLQWLESKLTNVPMSSLQGSRLRTETTSFGAQLTAQFDPLAAAGALGNLATTQSAQQALQAQNQTINLAQQQLYAALQSGQISYTNVLGPNPLSPAANVQASNATFAPPTPAISNPAPTFVLPNASNIVVVPQTTAQLTATEQFRDQLAYRDAVMAEIQERQLDDTHDRVGMTLYTLKFDLSVEPGSHNHSMGRADMTLVTDPKEDLSKHCDGKGRCCAAHDDGGEPPCCGSVTKEAKSNPERGGDLYNKWVQALRRRFDTEVISIQRRFLQQYLTQDEERQLLLLALQKRDLFSSKVTSLTAELLSTLPKPSELGMKVPSKPSSSTSELENLYYAIQNLSPESSSSLYSLKTNLQHLLPEVDRTWSALRKDHKSGIGPLTNGDEPFCHHVTEEKINNLRQALDSYSLDSYSSSINLEKRLDDWSRNPSNADTNLDQIMKALSYVISDEYKKALSPLVYFGVAQNVTTGSNGFHYLIPLGENTQGTNVHAFLNRVEQLQNKKARSFPYVYSAEPKESAQSLSDASAAQSAFNLASTIAAAVPQIGTSFGAAMQYMKQNQYMLQLIKRKPLLVSYMRGQTNFGWILGPRFKIKGEDLKLGYEQVPVRESVEATIGVPAWWAWVDIDAKTGWLAKDGEPDPASQSDPCRLRLRLRPDMDALVRAFLEDYDPVWFGAPQINPPWDPNTNKWGYVLQSDLPASLLILGRNLWRNPRIYIGSQGTSSEYDYTVLPDMQGLLVDFKPVQQVQVAPGMDPHAPTVDLRVVTSDGEAVLKNAVKVLFGSASNAPAGGAKTFVSLQKNWFVAGQPYSATVNTNLFPSSYASIDLYIADAAGDPEEPKLLLQTKPSSISGTTVKFSSTQPLPAGTNAAELALDIKLRPNPNAKPASVLNDGQQKVVAFADAKYSQLLFANTGVETPKGGHCDVQLKLADGFDTNLFWKAWLGIDGGTAQMHLVNSDLKSGAAVDLGSDENATPVPILQTKGPPTFFISDTIAAKLMRKTGDAGAAAKASSAEVKGSVIVTPASGSAAIEIPVFGKLQVTSPGG